jgi:hypothetical protein
MAIIMMMTMKMTITRWWGSYRNLIMTFGASTAKEVKEKRRTKCPGYEAVGGDALISKTATIQRKTIDLCMPNWCYNFLVFQWRLACGCGRVAP